MHRAALDVTRVLLLHVLGTKDTCIPSSPKKSAKNRTQNSVEERESRNHSNQTSPAGSPSPLSLSSTRWPRQPPPEQPRKQGSCRVARGETVLPVIYFNYFFSLISIQNLQNPKSFPPLEVKCLGWRTFLKISNLI